MTKFNPYSRPNPFGNGDKLSNDMTDILRDIRVDDVANKTPQEFYSMSQKVRENNKTSGQSMKKDLMDGLNQLGTRTYSDDEVEIFKNMVNEDISVEKLAMLGAEMTPEMEQYPYQQAPTETEPDIEDVEKVTESVEHLNEEYLSDIIGNAILKSKKIKKGAKDRDILIAIDNELSNMTKPKWSKTALAYHMRDRDFLADTIGVVRRGLKESVELDEVRKGDTDEIVADAILKSKKLKRNATDKDIIRAIDAELEKMGLSSTAIAWHMRNKDFMMDAVSAIRRGLKESVELDEGWKVGDKVKIKPRSDAERLLVRTKTGKSYLDGVGVIQKVSSGVVKIKFKKGTISVEHKDIVKESVELDEASRELTRDEVKKLYGKDTYFNSKIETRVKGLEPKKKKYHKNMKGGLATVYPNGRVEFPDGNWIDEDSSIDESFEEMNEAPTTTRTFEFPDNRKAKQFAKDIANTAVAIGTVSGNRVIDVELLHGNPKTADKVIQRMLKTNRGKEINEELKTFGEIIENNDGDELYIYASSNSELYRKRLQPVYKNAITKMAQGKYDARKAIKLFMYVVDDAAKMYSKEFSDGTDYSVMFPKSVREYVAIRMRDDFETEAELGNYDNFLPKKYQTTD
jgi:hypothetical protein